MDIPYKVRKEMEELSKQVFGSRSKYKKYVDNGYPEMLMKNITEIVPGKDGAPNTEKKTQVHVLDENGVKQIHIKRFTLESIKAYMLEIKAKQDEYKKQMADAQQLQRVAQHVQNVSSGSAL